MCDPKALAMSPTNPTAATHTYRCKDTNKILLYTGTIMIWFTTRGTLLVTAWGTPSYLPAKLSSGSRHTGGWTLNLLPRLWSRFSWRTVALRRQQNSCWSGTCQTLCLTQAVNIVVVVRGGNSLIGIGTLINKTTLKGELLLERGWVPKHFNYSSLKGHRKQLCKKY